jgi:recombination protein RecA
MKEKKGNDISVALENLEKGLGNKDGRPKIQLFSSYMDKNNRMNIEVIPFGIKSVDDATNMGGVPRGRMVELYGPESGGKSYLTLKLIASVQRMGEKAALIDIEHSFVPKWAMDNGVNVDDLLYGCDFDYGEQALEYVSKLCASGLVAVVVVDSTAALIPKAEIDGDIIDSNPGVLARMMSKAVRQIMDSSSKTNTTVVWVNQIREKLSIGQPAWGDSETTPGGRALKFYSHMRFRVVRIGKVFEKGATEDDKKVVATKSKIKVIKNKVAAPFGEGEFEIPFGEGANNPVVALVKLAYEFKAVGRKNIEEKMTYVFGKGKEQEVTGCTDFVALAEWFVKNNKVLELIQAIKEKAKEKEVSLPEEILKMELDLVATDVDGSANSTATSTVVSDSNPDPA